jgi:hypothetical protein
MSWRERISGVTVPAKKENDLQGKGFEPMITGIILINR